MKAVVIGYGGIGARHVRWLEELGHDVAVVSRRPVDAKRRYATVVDAVKNFAPDYAVIASRTVEHLDDLAQLAVTGFDGLVLVEKPLFVEPAALPAHRFAGVFVAYNLRFNAVVRAAKQILDGETLIALHAYVGQYLPDWRPTRDYRAVYSARRTEGGGALRDLSHELDMVTWFAGDWTRLAATGGHLSPLEIDSDDVFALLVETPRCKAVTVNMNYLDDAMHRDVVALTGKGTLRADLVAGTVTFGGRLSVFNVVRDDMYRDQHRAILDGRADGACTLAEGIAVTSMIAAAERAARDHVWVTR